MNWKHYGSTFLHGTGGFIHQRSQGVWSNLLGHRGTSGGAYLQNICPRSPVCISTDRLFVHLELSDPTEHKDQKTHWGCFSSLKSVFSSHPIWAGVHGAEHTVGTEECIFLQHLKYPGNRSLQERDAPESLQHGGGHSSVALCVCLCVRQKQLICEGIQLHTLWGFFVNGQ